jgi:hypothetical protein
MPMLCYPRNKLPGSVKPTSVTDGLDREFLFFFLGWQVGV